MRADLSQIVKEAFEASSANFTKLVEDAMGQLCREKGRIGNFEIVGRLVKLEPHGEALVVGDLHGDLESLVDILKGSNFLQKMSQNNDSAIVFLGDYGDRGECSKEVYYTVLKLKLLFPTQIILMRGNHEGPEDLLASPHDLPLEFQMKFGEKWEEAYSKIRKLFSCLYNAVLVEERCLMIHGGLPRRIKTIEDLAYAHSLHPKESFLEEMLWSDPTDIIEEASASPRGAGRLFGEKITSAVLKRLNVNILIRGHEPCSEGFKIDHKGKILTLFSRKGPPYFNTHGAYLDLELASKFATAEELVPFVHKF